MRRRGALFLIMSLMPAAAIPASWERCVEQARALAQSWAVRDGFHCPAEGRIEWLPLRCESPPPRPVKVRCSLPAPSGGRYHFHAIQWTATGQRTSELRMEEGRIVRIRNWHANGQLLSDPPYEGGTMHGAYRSWHPNGRVATVGEFFHGVRRGEWLWYHDDGTLRTRERYGERGELLD